MIIHKVNILNSRIQSVYTETTMEPTVPPLEVEIISSLVDLLWTISISTLVIYKRWFSVAK